MNQVQSLIDRQLGIFCRFNYDNILKRLVVNSEESFYGLQSAGLPSAAEHDPPIFACRFSEASGYEHILALANEDGRVAIQDTSTARSASRLEGFQCHNNAVFDLAWRPQYMNFVTVSGDHTACLWDVAEGAPRRLLVFSHHTRSVKTAAFRPAEPAVFASGARDGHVLLWDVRAAGPALVLRPDNRLTACHAAFAPRTPGSHCKRLRVDALRALSVTGLVFRDDLTLISCGECDGNIKAWDLRKNYSAHTREPLPKHSIPYCGSSSRNGYTNLVVDDARTRLYASCMDDVIYCFNVATYSALPERRYVGHENATFYIKTGLSPDGSYLVSGSSDRSAYVWNVRWPEPVVRLAGHRAEVTCAAWCQRGDPKIVTCSDDARHKIWRVGREHPEPGLDAEGSAEVVPRADLASLPQWGGPERTPGSLRRGAPGSGGAKRARPDAAPGSGGAKRARPDAAPRRTKRCLLDLMDATSTVKRPKLPGSTPEEPAARTPPAGRKRPRLADDPDCSPARRPCLPGPAAVPDWPCCVAPCSALLTPTKNYERRTCRLLSPRRSPKSPSPAAAPRSPVRVSPSKVRILSFTTPTKDLPNFVLDGEAPHLSMMSPVKRRDGPPDWLTLLARGRRGRAGEAAEPGPPSPREGGPARRPSVSEKIKPGGGSRTLLKYFSVVSKKQ